MMITTATDISQVDRETQRKIVELLRCPDFYPEGTSQVAHEETHISHVFLTDTRAYKLKKAVRFDFLDFSTPERRRVCCEHEVRLNRRLAADVYFGVTPVTRSRRGHLRLDGDGDPVDWLVTMRRLPADRSLDQLIAAGTLTEREVTRVADRLAGFYGQLPPIPLRTDEYREHLERHIDGNHEALLQDEHSLPTPVVERTCERQLRVVRVLPELFDARVCDGRIVDGHGDLRPEHIYLVPQPTVIDCIEFNDEYRQVDVVDELGFLAMECDVRDAGWIGEQVVEQFRTSTGDPAPERLVSFYKCYRACVRAKVAAIRATQLDESSRASTRLEASRYLQAAARYANEIGPPLLLVVCGLSGTGKSTLSGTLAEWLKVERIQTDAVRRELFGEPTERQAFNEGRYSPANRGRVYNNLMARAGGLLADGRSVVLDGTFAANELRRRCLDTARRRGAKLVLIRCFCPTEIAAQRITERGTAEPGQSDASVEVLRQQTEDPFDPDLPTVKVDTMQPLPDIFKILKKAIC